ncbi:MAG: hypothetical protein Q4A05_08660 [Ruminococcus sp.]|nr:hypothetical protein [Ruminococcus sp.]
MKDELIASIVNSAMGTATNVVNKVAEDHRRTLEKEEAIAREQEQTKRAIAQEEERTRREFVEKGLDKRHREEVKELQRKRQENPINTACPSCTGVMDVDRHKGILTCPYCGNTEVLDPIHCYDPILDGELVDLKPKAAPIPEVKPEPVYTPASDLRESTTQNGVIIEKLNVRPNKSFSSEASGTAIHNVARMATSADLSSVDETPLLNSIVEAATNPNEPITKKVASAAKLVDTEPVEKFVRHETRGLVLAIISAVCGVIGLVTCGVLIVPEVLGIILGIIPLIGKKSKFGTPSKIVSAIGVVASLSACALILVSVFILKK